MPSITPIAHRLRLDGEANGIPGNTRRSLEVLLAQFPNASFETDVRLTEQGQMLTFHDVLLDRLTTASGWVNKIERKQLSTIKVLSSGTSSEETIPELEDIFRLARGRGTMHLELKYGPGDPPGLLEKILPVLKRYPQQAVSLSSFSHETLLEVPFDIPISVLTNSIPPNLEGYLEQFLRTGRRLDRLAFTGEIWNLTDRAISVLKGLGIVVNAYVVLPQCFGWATAHGVNPITDHFAAAMQFVGENERAAAHFGNYSNE
jgi:glycerophosphoryl diester phosphodiesterase